MQVRPLHKRHRVVAFGEREMLGLQAQVKACAIAVPAVENHALEDHHGLTLAVDLDVVFQRLKVFVAHGGECRRQWVLGVRHESPAFFSMRATCFALRPLIASSINPRQR